MFGLDVKIDLMVYDEINIIIDVDKIICCIKVVDNGFVGLIGV